MHKRHRQTDEQTDASEMYILHLALKMSFCNKTDTLIVNTVKELLNRAHHDVLFTNILEADNG